MTIWIRQALPRKTHVSLGRLRRASTALLFGAACCITALPGCSTQHESAGMLDGLAQHGSVDEWTVSAGSRASCVIEFCGDGVVSEDEECDPRMPGWQDGCSDFCKRSVYKPCHATEECPGQDALCAAYDRPKGNQFCAAYCTNDDACPRVPGFSAACNFAWCALLCNDGDCPKGMVCSKDATFLDHDGHDIGPHDVCVTQQLD